MYIYIYIYLHMWIPPAWVPEMASEYCNLG